MAGSSSMVENREEYPYPSHISTPSLSVKLSDRGNYNLWKTQMIYFLTGHGMLGFINGKFVSPNGNEKAMMEVMEAWKRSDALVVSWILGTLSEEVSRYVVNRLTSKNPNVNFTAKGVWDQLECIYGPKILQQATEAKSREEEPDHFRFTLFENRWKKQKSDKIEARKKLYECIVKRDMDLVNEVLVTQEVSVTDKIFNNGNTALHVAVETSKDLEFFEKMLEKTPEDISLTDLENSDGSTLLHMAGTVGNIDAAEILMEKYPAMLYKTDKEGQTPLIIALSNMHSMFYWSLIHLLDEEPSIDDGTLFTDEVLQVTISYKNFYLAKNMIWWRCRKLNSDAVLMAIAQKYPCELSFWERIAAEFEDTPILSVIVFPCVKKRIQVGHEAFQVLLSMHFGVLAPSEKLNLISGAALQIQYELQWYEEVEKFVCPLNITEKNSLEETPQMVFMREHKELLSAGAQWMKSTANSYSITTTLITTVVFAAGITVPGGNNQDTGVPIFTNNPAFTIFAVSVAISLFTGVMSLLMFLSILTARFTVEDFLYRLPRKLIIGLVTLFISTTTMIIAFGAALFIVFGQNNGSLLIPIGALTGLTITFFVALQFPLVVDLMRTTYGSKRFGKRNATSKTCLQNYIRKITCRPIVKDKKEEKENMMEIDWDSIEDDSRYNFVNCDDIPFNI